MPQTLSAAALRACPNHPVGLRTDPRPTDLVCQTRPHRQLDESEDDSSGTVETAHDCSYYLQPGYPLSQEIRNP